MEDIHEIDLKGLKMTYVGQIIADGSGVGGSARLKNMVELFKNLGIVIDMISFSFYSEKFYIEKRTIDESLKITLIHIPKNLPRPLKAMAILPVFLYSAKSCMKSDLIFSDFITEIAYLPAVILGKIFNKPIVLDYIDTKFFNFIPHSVNKFAAQRADLIFAISHYLLDFCRNNYGSKNVIYLPIFIDSDFFKKDQNSRLQIRHEYSIRDDEIVIGYAGAFHQWEGLPNLLHAFCGISNNFPKAKLAIMGKTYSPGDDNISDLVNELGLSDKTILIPSQPYECVPKFLSAFDIFCCPKTDCEINRAANPVKVVEYMSMGLPCVCSAVGGIIDTIDDGINGILVRPGDVRDLQEKLKWVILNPAQAETLAENGRKKVIENNSYDALKGIVKHALVKIL